MKTPLKILCAIKNFISGWLWLGTDVIRSSEHGAGLKEITVGREWAIRLSDLFRDGLRSFERRWLGIRGGLRKCFVSETSSCGLCWPFHHCVASKQSKIYFYSSVEIIILLIKLRVIAATSFALHKFVFFILQYIWFHDSDPGPNRLNLQKLSQTSRKVDLIGEFRWQIYTSRQIHQNKVASSRKKSAVTSWVAFPHVFFAWIFFQLERQVKRSAISCWSINHSSCHNIW
jgi:hypothetical protein